MSNIISHKKDLLRKPEEGYAISFTTSRKNSLVSSTKVLFWLVTNKS